MNPVLLSQKYGLFMWDFAGVQGSDRNTELERRRITWEEISGTYRALGADWQCQHMWDEH